MKQHFEGDGEENLYFVVETKGSTWWDDLRHMEAAKIKCGKQHFAAMVKDTDNPPRYITAKDVDGVMDYT